MKFLCDEMLQRLGRWLRAAGYDTLIESDGRDDYSLLKQAQEEQRLLITRDRGLKKFRRADGNVVLLECNGLEDCVADLSHKLPIDWLHKPFSRCMVCNTPLTETSEAQKQRLPEDQRGQGAGESYYCPGCEKVYWSGSHVRHMHDRLAGWQQRHGTSRRSPPPVGG